MSSVFVLDFTRYFRCKVNVLFCNRTVPPPDEFQVWSAGFEAEIWDLGSETRSHSVQCEKHREDLACRAEHERQFRPPAAQQQHRTAGISGGKGPQEVFNPTFCPQ